MTYKEALESLEYLKSEIKCHYPVEYPNDYDYSIEKAIYAIKKQIAKRPLDADITNEHGYGKCPSCCMHVDVFEHNPYCDCGQKIDWSDYE